MGTGENIAESRFSRIKIILSKNISWFSLPAMIRYIAVSFYKLEVVSA